MVMGMGAVVLVSGGSKGLGHALTQEVPFPARVISLSRSRPPEGVGHITADLADPDSWVEVGGAIGDLIRQEAPSRAVFIHSAGTLTPIGFAGEVDSGSYLSNVLLNSAAGQMLGHYFLDAVAGRDGLFDMVMITSGAARSVYPGWSAYGAGKAALDHWVRHVGAEQAIRGGVRVSAIAPGVLDTAMQTEIRASDVGQFPEVDRFHRLHEEGNLVDATTAARKIWAVVEGGIDTGSVLDLRDF